MGKEAMNYTRINCRGAMIEVPDFLHPIWPFDLELDRWPSFCGSGEGIGDRAVPETTHGVCLSPACFVHDIDFIISPRTIKAFSAANFRFLKNSISLATSQASSNKQLIAAVFGSMRYWTFIMVFGWGAFEPTLNTGKPLDNIEVQNKIRKLTNI